MNQQVRSDVLIIGAGAAGTYFALLMAQKGYTVTLIEQRSRETVGQHLDVVSLATRQLKYLGDLAPKEGMPEFISRQKEGIITAPRMEIKKHIRVPFTILRLPLFLQRMYDILNSKGVNTEFSCAFKEAVFDNGKITGVIAEKGGNRITYYARVVVDASGVAGAVRTSLSKDCGLETHKLGEHDVIRLALRYIKWTKSDKPRPTKMMLDVFHNVFLNPFYMEGEAIIGTAHPGSLEQANKVLDDFLKKAKWPDFEVIKKEEGVIPFRRLPYSLVSDGLLLMGDAAAITHLKVGHFITAIWELGRIAADVLDDVLSREEGYVTKDMLWDINMRYFRNQGAQYAAMQMQIMGLLCLSIREMTYFLKNTSFINIEDIADDYNLLLTPGQYTKLVSVFMSGVFTRRLSLKNLKNVGRASILADKIRLHYKNFPENPDDFALWKEKAEALWKRKRPVIKEYSSTTMTYY